MDSWISNILSDSRVYGVVRTLRRWTETSVLLSRLGVSGLLTAFVGAVGLASVVFVYRSNLGAGIKFLSFALLFVGVAALVERLVEEPAE